MIITACDASTGYYSNFTAIASQLRCPVCDGQRIDSSSAPFALAVKRDICTYLHDGIANHAIISRINDDYGGDLYIYDSTNGSLYFALIPCIILLFITLHIMRN